MKVKTKIFLLACSLPLYADPQEDFIKAARRNNLKLAQKAYAAGIDINVADDQGKNAASYACENGNAAFLSWLAQVGADLTLVDSEGNNCYHLALKARKPEPVFRLLAEKGVDKNAQNQRGETPLMLSVLEGRKPAFNALIALGADPNIADAEQFSPLTRAIIKRRLDFVTPLLNAGANPNSENNPPLIYAFEIGNPKIFAALIAAGANPNAVHSSGQPLLVEAIQKERTIFAKALIEAGANTNVTNAAGDSLIVLAVRKVLPELVPLLIERGFSPESKDPSGKTLLQLAHESLLKRRTAAREKLFQVLLERGANPNTLSASGRSVLMELAENGYVEPTKLLIERGADIYYRDKSGNTVLHGVAQRGQLGVLKLLLEKVNDPNIAGDSGNTAMHFAVRAGAIAVVKLLKERGANLELKNNAGETPLAVAIGRQDIAMVKTLLGLGASLSDEARETPLALEIAKSGVVNARTIDLLKVLGNAGINLNATNRYGNNALSYALNRRNLRMAEALLKSGAKSETGDLRGNTLLHKLALNAKYNRFKNQELFDWVVLVLSYQHPDHRNAAGETALHIAARDENFPDMEAAQQFFETLVNFSAGVTVQDNRGKSVHDVARKVDWEQIAAANLPAAAQTIAQPLATPENEKFIGLVADAEDFFLAWEQAGVPKLARIERNGTLRAVHELPGLAEIAVAKSGVLVTGVRQGQIDGVVDPKCRQGQNLVVYASLLNRDFAPRWEHTWGKVGSCARTQALAVTHDPEGNTLLQAEFSGKRFIRRLDQAGNWDGSEIPRREKIDNLIFIGEDTAAQVAQNTLFTISNGKNAGRITKSRNWKQLALLPSGERYLLGDFTRLANRRGVVLWSEDAEGKMLWQRHFAGEGNMLPEALVAKSGRICAAGKTDAALHGQQHSSPQQASDYFVFCTTQEGRRLFTRLIPAAGLKLTAMAMNGKGELWIAFTGGTRQNGDIVLAYIDSKGNLFR